VPETGRLPSGEALTLLPGKVVVVVMNENGWALLRRARKGADVQVIGWVRSAGLELLAGR
jgi:hypothetical protein